MLKPVTPGEAGGGQEFRISDCELRKAELPAMKIIRIKNRVYAERRLKSHAEYAVIQGQQIFARIRCVARNKWVVLERADEQRFGLAVSPLNVISLRDVKQWAIERYRGHGAKG